LCIRRMSNEKVSNLLKKSVATAPDIRDRTRSLCENFSPSRPFSS
jgi:hypothetical protein